MSYNTPSNSYRVFHNALRILVNLDAHELLRAGVLDSEREFERFANNPFAWFIAAPDRKSEALWLLINDRQPSALKADQKQLQAAAE